MEVEQYIKDVYEITKAMQTADEAESDHQLLLMHKRWGSQRFLDMHELALMLRDIMLDIANGEEVELSEDELEFLIQFNKYCECIEMLRNA